MTDYASHSFIDNIIYAYNGDGLSIYDHPENSNLISKGAKGEVWRQGFIYFNSLS